MPSRFEFERAVRGSELPPLSRLLALTVATWADARTGIIPDRLQPSLTTLEESTGLSRASVRTHLNNLEDGKWLGRDRPTVAAARAEKARTKYKIRIPKGAAVSDSDGIELGQDVATVRAGAALDAQELGQELPQSRAGAALELGQEMTTTRAGAALNSSLSAESSVEYHYSTPAASDRLPAVYGAGHEVETIGPPWLQPLTGAMGRAGMHVPWKFKGDDLTRLHNDILRLGVPLMVKLARSAWQTSRTPVISSRFFYDSWHSTPTPEPTLDGRPNLRAVDGPSKTSEYLEDMAAIAEELRQKKTGGA